MTQLFNKNAIENKIHAMIEQANDTHTRIAVGFLDIDNFRDYNTLYGHQEGDRVIRFVASILKENIDGIVGRNGGDEFLFCLAAVDSKTTIENEIRTVFEKLQEGLINLETGERMSNSLQYRHFC